MIAAGAFSASLGLSTALAATVSAKHPASVYAVTIHAGERVPDGATGALHGVVYDPNGAVIPGAVVSLTNVETNTRDVVHSDGSGCYRFTSVQTGIYNLRIEARGFASIDVPMIKISASDNNRIDQTLSIATINETVEIQSFVTTGVMSMSLPEEPLIKAAQADDLEAVREALASVDANIRDKSTQTTALEHAVRHANRDIIQLLLWAKADVNARDRTGQTALMMLGESITPEIIWDLIHAGARVNLRDNDGDTALSEVASFNNSEALKTLLDAGAKVNGTNNNGETALMKAASEGWVNNIRILVQAGADLNQRNKHGKTALSYARENDQQAAVRLLISLGAIEFEEKEKEGEPRDSSTQRH